MSKKVSKQTRNIAQTDWDWVIIAIAVVTGLTVLYFVAQIIRWIVK